ncbi:MAG: 30S ribosomal protein S1 [Nitrospinota bacterium]|nr:30S ribosomal protein S1 [Nitrospinota bacterium]MDH5678152.1 30S ribosomal protein S1 [Nitrospinota bacterium]
MAAALKDGTRRVKESDYADSFDMEQGESDDAFSVDEYADLIDQSIVSFKQGEIIHGRVVKKTDDSVIVDIGFKSEGIIPLSEFGIKAQDLAEGDPVEVLLEKSEDAEGMVVLSKEKADRIRVWEIMAEKYDNDEIIEGVIVSKIKGGLTVDIGLKAFLPGSQIDLRPIKNLDKLVGEKHNFKIIKMNKKRGNIVLSRRAILEEKRKATKETTLAQLTEGAKVIGIVKNITEYGAFIDLGGIDGLLHITDMSWGRVNHPSEMFNIGDQVEVIVLKFDRESERVSLGYKQATADPWSYAEERYAAGARITGKVVSIADYGAFVELEQGVEGLVHISEMTWNKHVRHPGKIVNVGDSVEAVVLAIDKEKKRISLGMKQIQPNPWDNIEEKYAVNSIVEGRIRNVAEFGAFVELEEGVDGLIHISDMSWTQKVKHPSEVLKKRDKVRCMVLNIDKENERLSLGVKQLEKDPWMSAEEKYPVGADVSCKIVKITNFGAFAEIESGIEGLIHNSQFSSAGDESQRKALELEQVVTAKIIKVDLANRKIGLSIKAFEEGLSPEQVVSELGASADADESGDMSESAYGAEETSQSGESASE